MVLCDATCDNKRSADTNNSIDNQMETEMPLNVMYGSLVG